MEKFIFRGEECHYAYEWVSAVEFHFDFSPTLGTEFIDEDGDLYFIHCEYFEDEYDEDECEDECVYSTFTFARWYAYYNVGACSHFQDCLTNDECETIKQFMYMLMGK